MWESPGRLPDLNEDTLMSDECQGPGLAPPGQGGGGAVTSSAPQAVHQWTGAS